MLDARAGPGRTVRTRTDTRLQQTLLALQLALLVRERLLVWQRRWPARVDRLPCRQMICMRAPASQFGLRFLHRDLERTRIQPEQHVALVHQLIVVQRPLQPHVPGTLAADGRLRGHHRCVVGRDIAGPPQRSTTGQATARRPVPPPISIQRSRIRRSSASTAARCSVRFSIAAAINTRAYFGSSVHNVTCTRWSRSMSWSRSDELSAAIDSWRHWSAIFHIRLRIGFAASFR
jgi:hypothetical protein